MPRTPPAPTLPRDEGMSSCFLSAARSGRFLARPALADRRCERQPLQTLGPTQHHTIVIDRNHRAVTNTVPHPDHAAIEQGHAAELSAQAHRREPRHTFGRFRRRSTTGSGRCRPRGRSRSHRRLPAPLLGVHSPQHGIGRSRGVRQHDHVRPCPSSCQGASASQTQQQQAFGHGGISSGSRSLLKVCTFRVSVSAAWSSASSDISSHITLRGMLSTLRSQFSRSWKLPTTRISSPWR